MIHKKTEELKVAIHGSCELIADVQQISCFGTARTDRLPFSFIVAVVSIGSIVSEICGVIVGVGCGARRGL